jgi:uracil-DNA glycosylase family 4
VNLDDLHEKIRACTACGLREGCTQVVTGSGPPSAPIVFVGEAPGENEDKTGIPFVGDFGVLLRNSIERAQIPRQMCYITHLVRCRTPSDRVPAFDEIESCWPHMLALLKHIRPRILVTLGKPATFTMANKLGFRKKVGSLTITKLAGKPIYVKERTLYVFPVFHPAYALRGKENREKFKADLQYLGKAYPMWVARKD